MNDRLKLISITLLTLLVVTLLPMNMLLTSGGEAGFQNSHSKGAFKGSLGKYDGKWSFDNIDEWRQYAMVDEDSVEVVVGLPNGANSAVALLNKILVENEARLVDLVRVKKQPIAAVMDVPIRNLQSFALRVALENVFTYTEPNFKVELYTIPNDPDWSKQWGPKKVGADWAWNTTLGSESIRVAVIDTGIAYNHADLAANYVPLGYDWVNDDDDPYDDHGHGTHCAGIIAAEINNSVGIAGMAQVQIMAEKCLDARGYGSDIGVANAIIHAADNNATILSLSLGGYFVSELLHNAVKYAYYNCSALVIAAAGNDDISIKSYPAGYDEVVAVAATNQWDKRAGFSNWGEWIEVAAPGVDIYSTVPGGYESWSGTSMACPHVSGVAALAKSRFSGKSTGWIRELLKFTADDLGDEGFDQYYGYGRVNASRAVEEPPDHEIILSKVVVPKYIRVNETATIAATIWNFGNQPQTNVAAQLLINGTMVQNKTFERLESDSSVDVNFTIPALPVAKYNLTVYVLPVAEQDRLYNNIASRFAFVYDNITVPYPFDRVQEAIDEARPGDTVFVGKGIYEEDVVLIDDNVTVLGESKNETIINTFRMYGDYNHISNFRVSINLTAWTVILDDSEHCTVENIITNGTVYILHGQNNNVSSCFIQGFLYCIYLINTTNNDIESNYVTSASYGIVIDGYGTNHILDNEIVNTYYGIVLGYYPNGFADGNNVFRNNTVRGYYTSGDLAGKTGGMMIFESGKLSHFIHDIDTSNTLNGKPFYYLINQRDLQINPTTFPNIGYLALVNSTNVTVKDFKMESVGHGVLFAYVNNSMIKNMTFRFDPYGVRSTASNNVSIRDCSFSDCYVFAVSLENSSNALMRNNRIFNMTRSCARNLGLFGETLAHLMHDVDTSNTIDGKPIYYLVNARNVNVPSNAGFVAAVNSTGIVVKKCEITRSWQGILFACTNFSRIEDVRLYGDNYYGIQLIESNNNTIKSNQIERSVYGIELVRSSNNSIYLNNFIASVEKTETDSTNIWHGRWNVTGNFWITYYYYESDINGDGIGDTNIPYQGVDFHPLMMPQLPGDVNYDGKVDIKDTSIVSKAFGSRPGSPNWNPRADLDENAFVDTRDIAIVGRNYGKAWTDYWKVALTPWTVYAVHVKDQKWYYLTTIKVYVDDNFMGYTNSTFFVLPYLKHKLYVDSEYTEIVPGQGKNVCTFYCYSDVVWENPRYVWPWSSFSAIAYYTLTFYAELSIGAKYQYENNLTTIHVWIDGQYAGHTGSIFYVLPGSHTIEVESPYSQPAGDGGTYVYTFTKWTDGPTSNPRTISISSGTSLTALYDKTYEPPPEGPEPR